MLVDDGNSLQVEEPIENLQVKVQDHLLIFSIYLLPITGADLILGASWLASIGPHIPNYSNMNCSFFLQQ